MVLKMKKNDLEELKNKNKEELHVLLKEANNQLAKLRLEQASKKLKNVRQLFFQRKKIAILLTLISEKETVNG